jgi:CRISPR-associated protein Cmr4
MSEFILFLYAESPVHAGGSDSLDVIDLPIQREATTGYPVIWGQSLKGALRQAAFDRNWADDQITAIFGSAIGRAGDETSPGHFTIGDAQLVAMPVPTLRHTFAWVTSEIALGRLGRKYAALGADAEAVPVSASDRALSVAAHWGGRHGEVFGPCVVSVDAEANAPQGAAAPQPPLLLTAWAERIARDALPKAPGFAPFETKLRQDLVLVGSDVMGTLLRECTEQTVRVQLDEDSKTVKQGPFYSEYLPAETILAASLTHRGARRNTDDVELETMLLSELIDGQLLQIGGDETLGKGLMWARLVTAAASEEG